MNGGFGEERTFEQVIDDLVLDISEFICTRHTHCQRSASNAKLIRDSHVGICPRGGLEDAAIMATLRHTLELLGRHL